MKDLASLKHKILSIMIPTDPEKMKLLRDEITLDPNNSKLKEEFDNMLMRCSTQGLM